jgi:8-oxo-dGTP diphosphatase
MILGVCVGVLDDGRVLLIKRRDFEVWCMPGGEVDPGESLAQAAVREVEEETGLLVSLERLVGAYSRPNWADGGIHVVLFAGVPVGGALKPDANEVLDIGYFAPDALPGPLLVGHGRRLDDLFEGRTGLARSNVASFPLGTRAEAYRLRDESGLAPAVFYDQHIRRLDEADDLEVRG